MKTLAIEGGGNLDSQPFVGPTAKVELVNGREFWLCNNWDDLKEALDGDAKFNAHLVIGMKPRDIIIDPKAVASVERVS